MTQTQSHAVLLALLLPPVSYNPNAPILAAELAADGAALDAVLDSAKRIISASPWLFSEPALIPAWESLYRIAPPAGASIEQRQATVFARINATGGLSLAYFKNLIELSGYRAELDEPREFRAGQSRAGDRIYKPGSVTFYWRIRARHPDNSPLSPQEVAALRSWLAPLVPAGTHFDIEA